MRIVVAGATGVIGHHVCAVARARGHEVVELTRSQGTDLTTGAGLDIDLAEAGPSGRVADLSGPEPNQIVDLARRINAERTLGGRVIPISVPGAAGRAMRTGALRPRANTPGGTLTFEEWLGQ